MNREEQNDVMKQLQDPFPEKDIEWRVQSTGLNDYGRHALVLAYVTNRAIQERLDNVFGCFGWKNEYKQAPEGGILCGISVKIDGEWVTKFDGADNTNIEATKGGLSNSMKRAAVQWGIGRYLYKLETNYANEVDKGKYSAKCKDDGKWFKWNPPKLPVWALPREKGNFEKVKKAIESIKNRKDYEKLSEILQYRNWEENEENIIMELMVNKFNEIA